MWLCKTNLQNAFQSMFNSQLWNTIICVSAFFSFCFKTEQINCTLNALGMCRLLLRLLFFLQLRNSRDVTVAFNIVCMCIAMQSID